jgi:hypothetical protein
MIDGSEEASEPEHSVSGWRRVVAMGLAYWYVTAIALSVAAFIVWIALFRLGPTDEYWACMDAHARAFRGTGWQAEDVFLAADADCSRPPGLTEQAAHEEWLRRWEAL